MNYVPLVWGIRDRSCQYVIGNLLQTFNSNPERAKLQQYSKLNIIRIIYCLLKKDFKTIKDVQEIRFEIADESGFR